MTADAHERPPRLRRTHGDALRLVLLPGLDGSGLLFSPFVSALAPDTRVAIIDYPPRELRYEELVSHVAERVGNEDPYIIVAESFSGPIALKLAAQRPRGLRGLVLCATFTSLAGTYLQAAASVAPWISPRAIPMAALSWLLMGGWATAELRAALRRSLSESPPQVLRARALAALSVDASREAQMLTVPVLFLRPGSDRLIPASAYDWAAGGIRDVVVRTIDGPHFILQANPAACAREIAQFVEATCAHGTDGT